MFEALARLIADGGSVSCRCRHDESVTILTDKDGNLISCNVLAEYFRSGRQERSGCSVLKGGGVCPYELHNRMHAERVR